MTLLRNLAAFVRDLLDPDRVVCRFANRAHYPLPDEEEADMTTPKPARATRRSITRTLEAVRAERDAQDAKWGEQNHPDGTGSREQVDAARVAREVCDGAHAAGAGTWSHILVEEVCEALAESDPAKLRAELVQVAAVAVAWIEAIDRRADQ